MKRILSGFLYVVAVFVAQAAKQSNFNIIYTDDLGYADTSVQMIDKEPGTKHDLIWLS